MKRNRTASLALAGILCAAAVAGSTLSFPVLSSKCAPVQHVVNVLSGVMLGPWYALGMAFCASLLRNLLGMGSLLAFPGSMCGAWLCGQLFCKTKKIGFAVAGEIIGTGIIGGLLAYPVAVAFMGADAGAMAFYAYVVPFLVSTTAGAMIAWVLLAYMRRSGVLDRV